MFNKVIYGVQLHPCGHICYFTAGEWRDLSKGDWAVVRIDRGESLAEIVRILNNPTEQQPTSKNSALENTSAPNSEAPNINAGETESQKEDQNHEASEVNQDESSSIDIEFTGNQPFAGEPLQWEIWDGEEQEDEENSGADPGLCLDPRSPNIQPILRPANENDLKRAENNQQLSKKAHCFCMQRTRHHKLDMKMVQADYMLDGSKIIFYFTAPSRIDFRELVKDLVKEFRTRIELRQIGVRHETQMVGATGNCGMVCCCRRYMRRFAPVTIKMAKEQNLFLNPAKISGTCGRLLCCLAFEQEAYEEFHSLCPKMGKKYATNQGVVKVMRSSIFRNSLSLVPEEGEEFEATLDEWRNMNPVRQGQAQQPKKTQAVKTAQTELASVAPVEVAPSLGLEETENTEAAAMRKNDANSDLKFKHPQRDRKGGRNERGDLINGRRTEKNEPTASMNASLSLEIDNPEQKKEIKSVGLSRFLAATGKED